MKLATVFSGIGAIEQALKRMDLEHEIVFACDNGNITIDVDTDKELEKIKKMDSYEVKNNYVKSLYKQNTRRTNFVEQSYMANYDITEDKFFYDVKLLDGSDFKGKVDLFVGGSPCQSFSHIGSKGGLEDTRGTLFYDYIRLVKEIRPEVFIYENVYGVLTHDKGNTWKVMRDVFDEIGYNYKFQILNAKDYGIPQTRRRIFVVGFKDKKKAKKFKFPETQKLKFTMQDFLLENIADGNLLSKNGLLKVKENKGQMVPEKYFLSDKLKKYVLSPGTKNFYHKNAEIDLPVARALLASMGNSHRSSVNNYVTTDGRIRALTERETHRLMGYPDDYKIVVSKAQAYKQSGNSIVVDVLINLLDEILKVLK